MVEAGGIPRLLQLLESADVKLTAPTLVVLNNMLASDENRDALLRYCKEQRIDYKRRLAALMGWTALTERCR